MGFLRTQQVAEETMIDIIPRFSSPPLRFLSHTLGPFRTNLPISVPLWLALQLRLSQRCSISPPSWLDPASLLHQLTLEKANPGSFQPLPYHYIEVAHLLLHHARDDVMQADRVEEALSDLEEARRGKIHAGLMSWSAMQPTTTKLNGIAAMELESIRGMALTTLKHFYNMQHNQHQHSRMPMQQQPAPAAAAGGGGGGGGGGLGRAQRREAEAESSQHSTAADAREPDPVPLRSRDRQPLAPVSDPAPPTERLRRYR